MKLLTVLLGAVLLSLSFGFAQSNRLDDSDWWSLLRVDEPRPTPSRVPTPRENFEILGISLFDDQLFQTVTKRLGYATQVQRGDASTGRHQLCYVSLDNAVHLVFEQGEVESVVYVFRDGRNWRGSGLCRQSALVTDSVSTRSGLRLGMTMPELRSILGVPSVQRKNKAIYVREMRVKTPPKLLEEIRKNDLHHYSDEEFHRQFDFYDETVYIEARFTDSKLVYIAVSQAGTT